MLGREKLHKAQFDKRSATKLYQRSLREGARIESHEHHVPYFMGRKIAADHLGEHPDYYVRLKKCRL